MIELDADPAVHEPASAALRAAGVTDGHLCISFIDSSQMRRLNNAHGRLFATSGTKTGLHRIVELRDGPLDVQLIGFGQDARNELYALTYEPGESAQVWLIAR